MTDRRVVTKALTFTVLGFTCPLLNRVYPPGTKDTWQPGDQFEVTGGPDAEGRIPVKRGLAVGWIGQSDSDSSSRAYQVLSPRGTFLDSKTFEQAR